MAADPILDFSPLDAEGLREDLPSYRRKWSTLTNVIFREGRLRPRPGLREPLAIRDQYLPDTARGVPLAIFEILNPGSANENRQGVDYAMETIVPTSATNQVAGWTGDHTDIDETVPDEGATKMTTATTGAIKRFGFGNLSNSPEVIPSATVIVSARAARDAHRAVLKFYWSSGSTLLHTQEVSARASSETTDWQTFAFEITEDPANKLPLTVSIINSMEIAMEYAGGESYLSESVEPAGDGNYTEWKDASDSGTATYSDFDPVWAWEPESDDELDDNHGIRPAAVSDDADSRQSWTWSAISNTFASIISIETTIFCRTNSVGSAIYRLFYRDTGVNYTIGDVTITSKPERDFAAGYITSTTNPKTSAAWTQAELNGGEFGLERVSGELLTVITVHGAIQGLSGTATVEVDWMSVHVAEATGGGTLGVLGKHQLWSTDKTHYRLTDAFTPDIDDVTNSVALTLPPTVPVDYAVLYGQVYMVNGEDATRRYPTVANVYESLTTNNADGATPITGRTVASFADRILYGWVKDNTSFIPERVAFSKIFDGGTHNASSAGDLDLLDTEGGVVKLLPLSEDICAAYKQRGIYNLRRTGSDIAPIVRDVVDPFTECVAPRTVIATLAPSGTMIHLFLGISPTSGLNVYAYDGSKVTPVGDGIQKLLRRDVNKDAMRNAFAAADPEAGLYYLFIAEDLDQFPDSGYIYHIRTGAWTRFTLPFKVSAAGIWTIPRRFDNFANTTNRISPALDGTRQVMVTELGGRIMSLDFDAAYDTLYPASTNVADPWIFTRHSDSATGENRRFFTSTIETGDPRPSPDGHAGAQASAYAINVMHNAHAPLSVSTNSSYDGGETYGTAVSTDMGSLADTDAYVHASLDVPGVMSWRPRVKMEITSVSPEVMQINPRWEIAEMWLDVQPQGDKA